MQDIGLFLENMLDRFDSDKLMSESSRKGRGFQGGYSRPTSTRKGRMIDTTDTEAEEELNQFKRPYKQLMIWAVLMNRPELAKFFWEMGEEPITSALSASLLCIKMHRFIPKYLHSVRQDFLHMKKMFEELGTKVLDECHAQDPEKAIMLVERKSPAWSRMTCMQIAASANNQHFMSSVACQNSVYNVWKSCILSDWRRLSFIVFLGAYTYMVLVDYQKYPSPLEYFLMIWIATVFIGEVHTFITFPSATFWGKFRDWFTFLNRLDMANLVLAFIGFMLRLNSNYYMEAKTVYCVNVVIFYIRIMKVYIANSHLGPKLYMILRMVEELMMFIVVLVVFLLAYGVCSQGLLYKKREPSFQVIKDIIQFPYWQLYGEIFLEEIQSNQFGQHQLAYLGLFEKEMMANYLRRLKFESMDSMERKFTKLQKRVDMLNKIIEDKHVEDELAVQASLRLGEGLRVVTAVTRAAAATATSTPAPTLTPSSLDSLSKLLSHNQADGKGDNKEAEAEQNTKREPEGLKKAGKGGKETTVAFALQKRMMFILFLHSKRG
ncbi:hypothetical protein ACOMHN_016159 [Nucella lapillus]